MFIKLAIGLPGHVGLEAGVSPLWPKRASNPISSSPYFTQTHPKARLTAQKRVWAAQK